MQPLYLKKNTKSPDSSFYIRHAVVPYMYDKWHFHEELELNLILQGSGTRFIGDSIQQFENEDLVLVGSKLPHVWKNDEIYYKGNSTLNAEAILIQFSPDFLGKDFLVLPEIHPIKALFHKAEQGLMITGNTREEVKVLMKKMVITENTNKLLLLLQVLDIIAKTDESVVLSSSAFISLYNNENSDKINRIYDYITNNFRKKINLNEVAELSHMNVSSFCRYFKKVTKKTFIEFVNEIRIGYACKLLSQHDHNVTEACFESGYKNLSYFIRIFRSITGLSPSEYKKQFIWKQQAPDKTLSIHRNPE